MRAAVTYCGRCDHPMLAGEVLDEYPLLATEYRRPAPNGYICQVCQHDRPSP